MTVFQYIVQDFQRLLPELFQLNASDELRDGSGNEIVTCAFILLSDCLGLAAVFGC